MASTIHKEYYVISDLHLAEGSSLGPFYLGTENFEVDYEFSVFLDHLQSKNEAKKELIINGDFVDFIRIATVPKTDEDFARWQREVNLVYPHQQVSPDQIDCTEKRYGLKSNDYKTIWKLYLAISGHDEFFKALKKWLINYDNSLVIIEGNHDPEWYWPKVREYFIKKLTKKPTHSNIVFKTEYDEGEASYSPFPNVRIEHGHQVEEMNATESDRVLPNNDEELTWPKGSFFNRYVVNSAEMAFPYLDNMDPKGRYILNILKNNPVLVFGFAFKHVPYLWKMLNKFKKHYLQKIGFKALLLIIAALIFWQLNVHDCFGFFGHPVIAFILGLGIFNLMSLWNSVKSLAGIKPKTFQDKIIAKGLSLDIKNIIVGHNHNPEIISSGELTYYNSGTWTRGFNLSPSNFKLGFRLTYVKILSQSEIELMVWEPHLNIDRQFLTYKKGQL